MADESKSYNHGCVRTGDGATKIEQAFGKDSSDFVGSKAAERGKKLGGGNNDLSHSLSGATAAGLKNK
ncbi:MAG: hypothetical protein AB7O44_30345 [Hyphomicrobiaceae bacterium]